jgi:hypothetical protein
MVVLPKLRQEVCGRINTLLYGASAIPSSGVVVANWTGGLVVDMSAVNGVAGWPEGCVATTDTPVEYVYFKTVQEN